MTITNTFEIIIRKDLLRYNFTFKQNAENNALSDDKVWKILQEVTSDYPDYLRTLPEVILLDEFKVDTKVEKYALIINELIRKKILDVLPKRTKEYLLSYFTRVENRNNVKVVISDMYELYSMVTKAMFLKQKYVVDRFHYVTYIMDALDGIRIRYQKENGYNFKEYRLVFLYKTICK